MPACTSAPGTVITVPEAAVAEVNLS